MTVSIRIDSIYDKALAKLLEENEDMSIIPSVPSAEMIDSGNITPHDVHISDMEKREGIVIKGVGSAVTKIVKNLQATLPDSIVFNHDVHRDSIYLAEVTKYIYRKRLAIIDLGGEIKGILFNAESNVGDRLLLQIKELSTEVDKLPVCSQILTLSGNYCILEVGSNFVRISRKIKGADRKRLHELGKELLPKGFGLILRTNSLAASREDLEFEISQHLELWDRISEERLSMSEPRRLVSGDVQTEMILGYASKQYFDEIIAESGPIIPGFHSFKSYSMASGFTLEFAQHFIDKLDPNEMAKVLNNMILDDHYTENNHIRAEFIFSDGGKDEVSLGDIVSIEDTIKTKKILENENKIGNFTVSKNDIKETILSPGTWVVHYKYYSHETNEKIGERLQLVTPMDLVFRGRVRAFDMGVNIYKNSVTKEIIKSTRTKNNINMLEKGMITEEMDDKLAEILGIAIDSLENEDDEIIVKFE